jgi:F420H(2)-dependent quinone reductase
MAELARVGFPGLTIEGVAWAANVNRTTIYRRWPCKGALLLAVIEPLLERFDRDPDTGSLDGDLLSLMLLHTPGAKTGQARTSPLAYVRDGDAYVIAGSNGGSPRAPGWYYHLKANPDAEINVGSKRFAVTARPVLPGDPDYARLWRIVNKSHHDRFQTYQRRTSRPIPVIVPTLEV